MNDFVCVRYEVTPRDYEEAVLWIRELRSYIAASKAENKRLREALARLNLAAKDWHGSERSQLCNELCSELHNAMDYADAVLRGEK